jgi:hypothetical protein
MNAAELPDIFLSTDCKTDLEEMSCYLASMMQEHAIVHLIVKRLWKQKQKYAHAMERCHRHDGSRVFADQRWISGVAPPFPGLGRSLALPLRHELP